VIVLGIDTATPQVGCALWGPDGPRASFHAVAGRRHAEILAPALDQVCRSAGVELTVVDVVAVDVGPGLFTGLRVGVASAKAIGSALGRPVVACSSLELLAHPCRRDPRLIAAVVDARRGEVFAALYRRAGDELEVVGSPRRWPPGDLARRLHEDRRPVLAVGDGAIRYRELLEQGGEVTVGGPGEAYPSAAVLAELAATRASRGAGMAAREVVPSYLRPADVRIGWEQADGGGPGQRGRPLTDPVVRTSG
jgi:tRNA threonylcarbamoyladenosine biosynthesis protein TsaB